MGKIVKINNRYSHLTDDIMRILSEFDSSGETVYSGRNTLKKFVCSDETTLVVKRFGHLPMFRKLIYSTVCRSKACRAYYNGLEFLERGFRTPDPVAYIEVKKAGILFDSYFISLYSDDKALYPVLVDAERFDTALAECVAQFIYDLHSSGSVHGDPNLNNILYGMTADGEVRLSVIDTNRSYFKRHISKRRRLKNLMRVTHRRDLMRQIAGRYAVLSGMDPVVTVNRIFAMLERFERNRRIRHKFKSLVLRRRRD